MDIVIIELYNSKLWSYIMQFWEKKSELQDVNSEL